MNDEAIETIAKRTSVHTQLRATLQLSYESYSETDGASESTIRRMHVLGPSRGPHEWLRKVVRLQAEAEEALRR